MKRWRAVMVITGLFAFTWVVVSHAAYEDQSKQNSQSSQQIDDQGAQVETRLQERFGVSGEQLDNLRRQKLGYGEINIALSLAQQMPGGINDSNIQKVVNVRQGEGRKVGWGKVAQDLGVQFKQNSQSDEIMNESNANGAMEEGGMKPQRSVGGGPGNYR